MVLRVLCSVAFLAVTATAGCATQAPSGGGGGAAEDMADDDVQDNSATVTIVEGFGAQTRTGQATGDVEFTICDGWFAAEPNNIQNVDDSLSMTIRASGDQNLRLMVICGQSTFCGSGGTSQEIFRFWTTGSCDVYVGTADEGGTAEYTLEFIEN